MAETTIDYEDDEGFEIERNGESFLVFGSITARFSFEFYSNKYGYEWSDKQLEEYDIDVQSIVNADSNDVGPKLTDEELLKYTKFLIGKAEDYLERYGISEYAEKEPEYEGD